MRVRKGKKGMYYTNNKLDDCSYNEWHANIFEAYQMYLPYNLKMLPEYFGAMWIGIQGLIMLVLLPIAPLITTIIRKHEIRDIVSKEHMMEMNDLSKFHEDYYEEVDKDDED